MESQILNAEIRTEVGKNANRRLRATGIIPAIMNAHGQSEVIQVKAKDFSTIFKGHISESVIINLNISGKEECQVFVKDYKVDPVSEEIEHLDFYKVTAGEKIHTKIVLEFTGSSIGAKQGGIFEQLEREVEVEVLPKELQEKLVIDVTNLDINESIHIKDIQAPQSMTFKLDDDHIVAHVIAKRAVVEEEAEEADAVAETE